MSDPTLYIILMNSIHDVMAAEAALKDAGVPRDLVPVPRQVAADCGLAVELEPQHLEAAMAVITGRGLKLKGLYKRHGREWRLLTTKDEKAQA